MKKQDAARSHVPQIPGPHGTPPLHAPHHLLADAEERGHSQLLRGQELRLVQRGRGCSTVPSQEVQSESLLSQAPEKHLSSLCLRNLEQRECGHRLVFVFFQRTGNPGPLRKRSGVSPGPCWGLHPDSSNLL